MFQYPLLEGGWCTDTVFSLTGVKVKSGNICGQIFANEEYFAKFYPMENKRKSEDALGMFCKDSGVSDRLRMDGSKENIFKKTRFQK